MLNKEQLDRLLPKFAAEGTLDAGVHLDAQGFCVLGKNSLKARLLEQLDTGTGQSFPFRSRHIGPR